MGSRGARIAVGVALAALVLGAAVARLQRLPGGVEPIAWDREVCAECHMHVGDPHFAAQLQTRGGEVLNFDDPGCLLRYLARRAPAAHAVWLRHLREDRWLRLEEAGFLAASPSPMGRGLGTVDRSVPGALGPAEATARVMSGGARPPAGRDEG